MSQFYLKMIKGSIQLALLLQLLIMTLFMPMTITMKSSTLLRKNIITIMKKMTIRLLSLRVGIMLGITMKI
jgi:hypothetical protein